MNAGQRHDKLLQKMYECVDELGELLDMPGVTTENCEDHPIDAVDAALQSLIQMDTN